MHKETEDTEREREMEFSMHSAGWLRPAVLAENFETPSRTLGSNLSCPPPVEMKPISLEGNPHRLLSEICFPWNFMTYLVFYNHFLNEDDSS